VRDAGKQLYCDRIPADKKGQYIDCGFSSTHKQIFYFKNKGDKRAIYEWPWDFAKKAGLPVPSDDAEKNRLRGLGRKIFCPITDTNGKKYERDKCGYSINKNKPFIRDDKLASWWVNYDGKSDKAKLTFASDFVPGSDGGLSPLPSPRPAAAAAPAPAAPTPAPKSVPTPPPSPKPLLRPVATPPPSPKASDEGSSNFKELLAKWKKRNNNSRKARNNRSLLERDPRTLSIEEKVKRAHLLSSQDNIKRAEVNKLASSIKRGGGSRKRRDSKSRRGKTHKIKLIHINKNKSPRNKSTPKNGSRKRRNFAEYLI
jgi:hypothetical protein